MKKIPFGKPILGEEEKRAVMEALDGSKLVHGPRATLFEQEFSTFCGGGASVSVSSCTAGMHLFYFNLGIGPGDEVIVPAQTHVATAHAVELTGAKAVFVDAEPTTGNMNLDLLEAQVNSRTKAIAIVHYLGMPIDMVRVNQVAKKHDIPVLEDCALALGTRLDGIHAGLHGTLGVFSFYPVKHMTTAEGGMVLTKNSELAFRLQRKKAFGVDRTAGERSIPGLYEVDMLGLNYRLNEIQAALGIQQLKRVPGFLQKRKINHEALARGLREIPEIEFFQSSHDRFESSYYCFSFLLPDRLVSKRAEIIGKLNQLGVGTSVYYPRPVPHFQYYREKYGHSEQSFPVAARISYGSIALPVGPHLEPGDVQYISSSVKAVLSQYL